MAEDVLDQFTGMSICPVCGSIEKKGSFRCLGCGAFHSNAHLVDRDAPPPQLEKPQETDLKKINPLAYSMGPNQKILEEEFEQSEDVVDWQGGSTDFSFKDDIELSENNKPDKVVTGNVEEL